MYDALYTYTKKTLEILLYPYFTFAEKRPCLSLNQIEILPVVCNILPVGCNLCSIKCSIYVDHVKFPLGLILATILTPKVENEVFDRDKNEVLTGTK